MTNQEKQIKNLLAEVEQLRRKVAGLETEVNACRTAQSLLPDNTGLDLTREELRESNNSLEQIIHAIPDPLTIINASTGVCIDINNQFSSLTGWAREEVIGRTARDIDIWVNPENRKVFIDLVFKNGFVNDLEADFKRKDKSIFTGIIAGSLISLKGEQCIITVTKDISQRKEIESALTEGAAKYRYLYDNALVAMFTNTLEGKPVAVNDGTLRLLGYQSKQEFLEKFNAVDHWVNPLQRKELIDLVLENRVVHGFQSLARDTSGKNFWAEFSVRINQDKNTFDVIAIDITDRKLTQEKLRQSEEKFRTLVDQASEMLFLHDLQGKITDVNEAAIQNTGYSRTELEAMNVLDIDPDAHDRDDLHKYWKAIKTDDPPITFEGRHQRKDGSIYPAEITISKVTLLENEYILGLARDFTERKQAEEKIKESDRLKSAFLANISHEIRTPMNGIMGFTALLKEPGLSEEEQHRFLEVIQNSGNRLLSTVNDLIDISRIETGQMPLLFDDTDVKKQIESLVTFFKPQTEKKGLRLTMNIESPEVACFINTDQNKLVSILTNLIKNAIKYTETGEIKIGCNRKEDFMEVVVEDTGIGIPKNRQEAIFNRFEQADITDKRAFQGSGLGLSIAKAYVEMLGGKIWLKSEEGSGSTFYFTLPLDNKRSKTSEKVFASHELNSESFIYNEKKFKILIAEDDETGFLYLSVVLNDIPCEIFHTATGTETVEFCRNNPDTDIILMDIKMPLMDGYEATRKIREFNKDVLIIAQTAYALTGDKGKALAAGCNDYITKPIARNKLLNIIHSQIIGKPA